MFDLLFRNITHLDLMSANDEGSGAGAKKSKALSTSGSTAKTVQPIKFWNKEQLGRLEELISETSDKEEIYKSLHQEFPEIEKYLISFDKSQSYFIKGRILPHI